MQKENSYYAFVLMRGGRFRLDKDDTCHIDKAWQGYEIAGCDYGSAYNMPVYLIGEMEECGYEDILVTLLDPDDAKLPVKLVVGKEPIKRLMEELDKNLDNLHADSFLIALDVWREFSMEK